MHISGLIFHQLFSWMLYLFREYTQCIMLLGFLFDQPSINIPLWKAHSYEYNAKNSNYRELHWCSLTINIGWEISLTATNRWKSLFFSGPTLPSFKSEKTKQSVFKALCFASKGRCTEIQPLGFIQKTKETWTPWVTPYGWLDSSTKKFNTEESSTWKWCWFCTLRNSLDLLSEMAKETSQPCYAMFTKHDTELLIH